MEHANELDAHERQHKNDEVENCNKKKHEKCMCLVPLKLPLNITIWAMHDNSEPNKAFPEQKENYVHVTDRTVGFAMSGGGSRAFCLTTGYLRGLMALGKNNEAAYISSVSGGCWASSIYTFASDNEEELLGKPTEPGQLIMPALASKHGCGKSPGKMVNIIPNFFGMQGAIMDLVNSVPTDKLWQRMIGEFILHPFDLDKKLIAMGKQHSDVLLANNHGNEEFEDNKFVYPSEGRPYIIMNATLDGPVNYTTGPGASMQFTPMYGGVPFYPDNAKIDFYPTSCFGNLFCCFKPKTKKELLIGGGALDTYAWGCQPPTDENDLFGAKNVVVRPPKELFTLEDCVGASSAAFVSEFQTMGIQFANPRNLYWPVLYHPTFKEPQDPQEIIVADGGSFENTGLLALLQRGVKKAICFINSAEKIDLKFFDKRRKKYLKMKTNGKICYQACDTQLLCLFGLVKYPGAGNAYDYTRNQVFERNDLEKVLHGLIDSVKDGKGAVTVETLKVLENNYWNIEKSHVKVMFIYNASCEDFEKKLPRCTRDALKGSNEGKGAFANFPWFATTRQNSDNVFGLTQSQAALLAAHGEHVIRFNETKVLDFFNNDEGPTATV